MKDKTCNELFESVRQDGAILRGDALSSRLFTTSAPDAMKHMKQITVHLGTLDDVGAAATVYERSNFVRRHGDWPSRATRVAQVTARLKDGASWFLIGRDDAEVVAMAHVYPFRADDGSDRIVPGTLFLNLLYVLPDRWGNGIGGTMLDAVIAESARRGCQRIYLWTHERYNERAQRLYRSRGFAWTGRIAHDEAGKPIGEWRYDGSYGVTP